MEGEAQNSLHVDRPPALASQLATECVDLAWVDAGASTGLFQHLLDSIPRQLSLFEPAVHDPVGGLPAAAIPILERFFRNLHRVLRSSGHIFVLCEPTTDHRIKVLLDTVFGAKRFAGEFVTVVRGVDDQGPSHQSLIVYAKTSAGRLNQIFRDPEQAQSTYRYVEEASGRRYALGDCSHSEQSRTDLLYEWNGVRRVWRWKRKRMSELHAAGRLVYTKSGLPRVKRYLDEASKRPLGSIWTEGFGQTRGAEHSAFTRVVLLGTTDGGIILDAYCTSTGLLAAATKANRSWIAITPSHRDAARVRNDLRNALGPTADDLYTFHGPRTRDGAITLMREAPAEFKSWALGALGAVFSSRVRSSDIGIDGRLWLAEATAPVPVLIKTSDIRPHDVREMVALMRRDKHAAVIVVTPFKPRQDVAHTMSAKVHSIFPVNVEQLFDLDRVRFVLRLGDILRSRGQHAASRRLAARKRSA